MAKYARAKPPFSLRGLLLSRLLPSLITVLLASGVLSYLALRQFADEVYDRELLGAAQALATQLEFENGRAELSVTTQALNLFRQYNIERTHFRVMQAGRMLIASGDFSMPPTRDSDDIPDFFETKLDDEQGRAIRFVVDDARASWPVVIELAETTRRRNRLEHELLLATVAPQILVLLLVIVYVQRGVRRGLAPLTALSAELASRPAEELSPLPIDQVPSELALVMARFNDAMSRHSNVLASHRHFVADAAHQLRTPLAAIKLEAEIALHAGRVGEHQVERRVRRDEALQRLHHTTDRTIRLANQLLSLARAEPNAPIARDAVDLVATARERGADWMPRALARRIEIEFDAPEAPVWVNGDVGLLGEMIGNLLDNALLYSVPVPGVPTIVWLKVMENPPRVIVENMGPPLAEEIRRQVFNRFYRAPEAVADGTRPGSGLGLAVVSEIAARHGARAELRNFEDARGSGVTAIVTFAARSDAGNKLATARMA